MTAADGQRNPNKRRIGAQAIFWRRISPAIPPQGIVEVISPTHDYAAAAGAGVCPGSGAGGIPSAVSTDSAKYTTVASVRK